MIEQESKLCPTHNIPMETLTEGPFDIDILDPDTGQPTGETREDYTQIQICPECEYAKQMKEYNISDLPEDVEMAISMYEESEPEIQNTVKDDFLSTYTPFISQRFSVPDYVAEAACQFLISSALKNANYTTNKGRVLSNMAFRHLAQSGHNKTPLFNYLQMVIIPRAFESYDFQMIGRGTGRGYAKMVANESKKGNRRTPIFFMKDEDSVLYLDSASDSGQDIFETYSDMYDGKFSSNTTVVNGHIGDHKAFVPYWTTGTFVSMSDIKPKYFIQGWGNRLFNLIDKSPLEENLIADKGLDELKGQTDRLVEQLQKMTEIGAIKTTEAFMEGLNQYNIPVLREKNRVEQDPDIKELSEEWERAELYSKAPVHLIKLSMVHAASRWNVKKGELWLDTEDLEYAEEQFAFYIEMNMRFYHEWLEKRSSKELGENKLKITHYIESTKEKFDMEYVSVNVEQGEDYWKAIPKPDGKWAKHSDLLRSSHLVAKGFGSFESVTTTMMESEELAQRTARIYYKDSQGRPTFKSTDFYKLLK